MYARTKRILNLDWLLLTGMPRGQPRCSAGTSPSEHHQPLSSYSQDVFLPRGGKDRWGARGRYPGQGSSLPRSSKPSCQQQTWAELGLASGSNVLFSHQGFNENFPLMKATAGELDGTTSKGPLQPKPSYDSIIIPGHWGLILNTDTVEELG